MSSNRQFQPVNKREVLEHMKIEQKREIVQVKAEGPPETKLVDHPEAKVHRALPHNELGIIVERRAPASRAVNRETELQKMALDHRIKFTNAHLTDQPVVTHNRDFKPLSLNHIVLDGNNAETWYDESVAERRQRSLRSAHPDEVQFSQFGLSDTSLGDLKYSLVLLSGEVPISLALEDDQTEGRTGRLTLHEPTTLEDLQFSYMYLTLTPAESKFLEERGGSTGIFPNYEI